MSTTVKLFGKEIVIESSSDFQLTSLEKKRKQDDCPHLAHYETKNEVTATRFLTLPQRVAESIDALGGTATLQKILLDFESRHSDYVSLQPLSWRKRVERTVSRVCNSVGEVEGHQIWKSNLSSRSWNKNHERATKSISMPSSSPEKKKKLDPVPHCRPSTPTTTRPNMQTLVEEALQAKGGTATSDEIKSYLELHYPQELTFWTDWRSTVRHLLPRKFEVTPPPDSQVRFKKKLYSLPGHRPPSPLPLPSPTKSSSKSSPSSTKSSSKSTKSSSKSPSASPKSPSKSPSSTTSESSSTSASSSSSVVSSTSTSSTSTSSSASTSGSPSSIMRSTYEASASLPEVPPDSTPEMRSITLPKKKRPLLHFAVKTTTPPVDNRTSSHTPQQPIKQENTPDSSPILTSPEDQKIATYTQIIGEALESHGGTATKAEVCEYAIVWYPLKFEGKPNWNNAISSVLSQDYSKVGVKDGMTLWGKKKKTTEWKENGVGKKQKKDVDGLDVGDIFSRKKRKKVVDRLDASDFLSTDEFIEDDEEDEWSGSDEYTASDRSGDDEY